MSPLLRLWAIASPPSKSSRQEIVLYAPSLICLLGQETNTIPTWRNQHHTFDFFRHPVQHSPPSPAFRIRLDRHMPSRLRNAVPDRNRNLLSGLISIRQGPTQRHRKIFTAFSPIGGARCPSRCSRVRNLLSAYYGLGRPAGPGIDELDLDSPHFNAEQYTAKVLKEKALDEILRHSLGRL